MRDIKISINNEGYVTAYEKFIANQFENEATRLIFDLPKSYCNDNFKNYVVFRLSNDEIVIRKINDTSYDCIIDRDVTKVSGVCLFQTITKKITSADDLADGVVMASQPISGYVKESTYYKKDIKNFNIDANIKIYLDEFDALLSEIRNANTNVENNLTKYTTIITKLTDDLNERIAKITDNASDMTEVVDARGGFTNLGLRLDKNIINIDTVEMMKSSQNLKNGDVVKTLGYNTVNDGGEAIYKLRLKTDDDIDSDSKIIINDSLVAILTSDSRGIVREKQPNDNFFHISSDTLSGKNKSSRNPIIQLENKNSCIEVIYNENLVENIRVSNPNNYENKIGIDVLMPSQRNKFDSIYIDNNFKYGMKIPQSYYSQFNDVWFSGEIGLLIGNIETPSNWIGVLNFNDCHFKGSKLAVKQVSTDTNTICIDKSSFEHNLSCIENVGKMYFRNTYFGDSTNDTKEKVTVLTAKAGSETYFDDCTITIDTNENDNSVEIRNCIFDLKSNSTVGSEVHVFGGILSISNNNINNHYSAIYDSDSDKNLLFLDDVKFIPSNINQNHSVLPYKVFDHSPLRSKKPIKNYIINGTLKNPIMNEITIKNNTSNMFSYVENLVNPFGGKIIEYNKTGQTYDSVCFYYKVPKCFLNKEMVLECYLYDESDNKLRITSDGLGLNYLYPYAHTNINDETRTRLIRLVVTPIKEISSVQLDLHNSVIDKKVRIFGVILKEKCYKDNLSCYEDQDIMLSSQVPTNTADAIKGDMVYCTPTSTCDGIGWIFNGVSWEVMK